MWKVRLVCRCRRLAQPVQNGFMMTVLASIPMTTILLVTCVQMWKVRRVCICGRLDFCADVEG